MSTFSDTISRAVRTAKGASGRGRPARHKLLLHAVLLVSAIGMALPFVWMLFSSFKPLGEIFMQPPKLFPQDWNQQGYRTALEGADFVRGLWNSTYIALTVTAVSLLTSAMAAYAFARIDFWGRRWLFMVFLATMMVPGQLTIIPLYIIMGWLGWVDTHAAIIVPPALFNAFGVFLLRQYIKGIPVELEEAAQLDGAGRVRRFVTIILPLLRTPLTALGIFTFLAQWNNFFTPLIFLNSSEKFTLPLLVNQFMGQYTSDWPALMAATTLLAAPMLVVFAFAQRQIVEGIALSGSKS
ncbi:carbohydrate ABC transporter permease [Streptomyces sp. ME19-01-6]|uniref:carbohydrate ABC transporter permease n=1 Tax=Streptomyces sp. ME19-01-6 TaxID=3028686 RepID=UPI0029A18D34|nr:carbohydrate ABC transporter permease [Streptomyces sp. ME19-01-6]MDX3224621.1 carbohydrate ABC transporter permease [Streptomyces sp. ME19-01-6]